MLAHTIVFQGYLLLWVPAPCLQAAWELVFQLRLTMLGSAQGVPDLGRQVDELLDYVVMNHLDLFFGRHVSVIVACRFVGIGGHRQSPPLKLRGV